MKLPLSIIKTLITIDLPVQKISETLTLLGLEVDRIWNEHPSFANVVVGEVISAKRHPNAEKLQVAEVRAGDKIFTLVCAAPNCRPGIKTAFAKLGAFLKDANGAQRTIEKTAIRGVESDGMLCSAAELLLAEESDQILELPSETISGQDLATLLWDPVFEISLTPNLGHCMSALGIARELSAALQIPVERRKPSLHEDSASSLKQKIHVDVSDFQHCPRYACRLIEDVKIAPSPFWLVRALESCGLKSVNNAVDALNYTMMKIGQPFHAFDFDLIDGHRISVSSAKTDSKFLGLDGVERNVAKGTILISDAQKPVAIAGIMGGANSAVSSDTTRILIEAAVFDPASIRSASKKMALRTESSQRFEKGVDPESVAQALDEACALILEVCSGRLAHGTIDLKKAPFAPKEIGCRADRTNQILGTKLSLTEIEAIFHRLGFKTAHTEKGKLQALQVQVPLYRADLNEEIDLIEEVARVYGYNNIEKRTPLYSTSQIPHDPVYLFEKQVREKLCGFGLQEFLTCDLISPALAHADQDASSSKMTLLRAKYSKSEDYSVLRASLLPGHLQAVRKNLDQKNQTIAAFEIGRIHFLQRDREESEKFVELPMAALLLTGKREPSNWSQKTPDIDFFDLKGLLENLFHSLRLENYSFKPSVHLSFHPGRQADIAFGDLIIGSFGEVHPSLLEKFDVKQRTLFAEVNLLDLMKLQKKQVQFMPLSQFPSSERDWTLPLDLNEPIDRVFKAIHSVHSPFLEKTELLDLYTPENGAQKNATFRFTYRDRFKTLSFEETEAEHAKIVERVSKLLAK